MGRGFPGEGGSCLVFGGGQLVPWGPAVLEQEERSERWRPQNGEGKLGGRGSSSSSGPLEGFSWEGLTDVLTGSLWLLFWEQIQCLKAFRNKYSNVQVILTNHFWNVKLYMQPIKPTTLHSPWGLGVQWLQMSGSICSLLLVWVALRDLGNSSFQGTFVTGLLASTLAADRYARCLWKAPGHSGRGPQWPSHKVHPHQAAEQGACDWGPL